MARRRLKTATDLRRYIADLMNRVEQQEIDPQVASKQAEMIRKTAIFFLNMMNLHNYVRFGLFGFGFAPEDVSERV